MLIHPWDAATSEAFMMNVLQDWKGDTAKATVDLLNHLRVPTGGSTRQITVSVIWQPLSQGVSSGAKLQVTYSMSVAQQSSVKWYVKEIGASIEAVGAQ